MKKQITWLSTGGLIAAAAALTSLADPIPFPESRTYTFDFETDPLESGWILDGWLWDFIPEGSERPSEVRPSEPSALDDLQTFNPDGNELTLEPKVAASSYKTLGFSGESWIWNSAGIADEEGIATGSALLEFTDLPEHTSISIDMKLGIGGSIDGDDGPFEIRVDGEPAFSSGFGAGGGGFAGGGVTQLATGANLTPLYIEQWDDRGGQGPASEADRSVVGWTLDSAYDLSGYAPLKDIPHSSDTLSIEFIHHLKSGGADEHHAMDDLKITLSELGQIEPSKPNQWRGGDTQFYDFSDNIRDWTLSQWTFIPVPQGPQQMTGEGNGNGLVRLGPNDDAFGQSAFNEGTNVFPLEPILEAQSFSDIDPRFSGDWLQSSGAGAQRHGTATLFLENLPPHDGLEMSFVLGATDSHDGDDVIPDLEETGNFQILVDGEPVIVTNAKSNVNGLVEELVTNANLTGNYRENWLQIDEGPTAIEDRESVGWTLDNAYDWSTIFAADGENPIAHSAETLTVTFVHGLDSNFDDEGLGIDSLELKLLNVTEKVEFAINGISVGDANAVTITWNASAGKTYGVDRSLNLSETNNWDELADGVDVGTFTDNSVPAGTREAYYRVRIEPAD